MVTIIIRRDYPIRGKLSIILSKRDRSKEELGDCHDETGAPTSIAGAKEENSISCRKIMLFCETKKSSESERVKFNEILTVKHILHAYGVAFTYGNVFEVAQHVLKESFGFTKSCNRRITFQ